MKKLIIIVVAIVISGCGFAPMYSDNSALQSRLSDIYIAPIAGTNGIDLRNYLAMSWNTSNIKGAKYRLVVNLQNPRTIYKGLQRSGDATWDEVRVNARWTLYEDKNILAKSSESASESYTFVSDLVSASASKNAATSNAVLSIGEKIDMKVSAKLKELAKYEN